jgi:putative FmdB family regulatory protein
MPFYEYECPHCGYHDEVLQKIADPPLKKCPTCGKKGLRKLMSAPVFRLKGSGWYETDFKSDKENKRNLAGAEKEEAKVDAKADTKTDAKPEPAKADAAKKETPKPAAETASTSARKNATRSKSKQKGARTAKRLARR